MAEFKTVSIRLTSETEGLIRKCAKVLYGDEALQEPLEEIITNFLPDLLQDALNSPTHIGALCSNLEHTIPDMPEDTPILTSEEIHREVEAIAEQVEDPGVKMPLEMSESEPEPEEEPKAPTLEEILSQPESQQINNSALQWAKGNPAKESALAETLWALPSSLWSMARVRDLAERTYTMRLPGPDA